MQDVIHKPCIELYSFKNGSWFVSLSTCSYPIKLLQIVTKVLNGIENVVAPIMYLDINTSPIRISQNPFKSTSRHFLFIGCVT